MGISISKQMRCNGHGTHHQIIHFVGGIKRQIQNVKYVWENEMTHIVDTDGVEYIINKNNVLFVEKLDV